MLQDVEHKWNSRYLMSHNATSYRTILDAHIVASNTLNPISLLEIIKEYE